MHTPKVQAWRIHFQSDKTLFTLSDAWMLINTVCGREEAMIFKPLRNARVKVLTKTLMRQKDNTELQGGGISWCKLQAIADLEACFIWYAVLLQRILQKASIHKLYHNFNIVFYIYHTHWKMWHFSDIIKGSHLASQPVDFSPIKYQVFPHKLITARDWQNI